jgi:hypothetical protein
LEVLEGVLEEVFKGLLGVLEEVLEEAFKGLLEVLEEGEGERERERCWINGILGW